MNHDAHDIQVKVQLTAEEYLASKNVADYLGVSQSALFRMLIKEKIRVHAQIIRAGQNNTTDEHGQE